MVCRSCGHARAYHCGLGTPIAKAPSEAWFCAYPTHQDGTPCNCQGFTTSERVPLVTKAPKGRTLSSDRHTDPKPRTRVYIYPCFQIAVFKGWSKWRSKCSAKDAA